MLVQTGNYKADYHSATSNALAKVLGIDGEVIIGDKALKLYLQNPNNYIDLAKSWNDKHQLPFVFARFCANRHYRFYKKLIKKFLKNRAKLPQYIIANYSKRSSINQKDIKEYLELISYNIDTKSKKSLKLFLKDTP